jgi:hypothetical protein
VAFSPLQFLLAQPLETVGPIVWAIAMCGLGWLLVSRRAARVRALGWTYPVIFAVMVAAGGAKPYYLAPAYTVLLAAGGVALGSWTSRWPGTASALLIAVIIIAGALAAPLAKPLLPVETYVRYAAALGQEPSTDERHELGRLPQFFADMHGWPELAAFVGRVYRSLPPEDRSRACIFGQNYGEAGAVAFFGARDGLPRAISGHNTYHLWGPGECTGAVMIVIGDDLESLAPLFRHVERAATFTCTDCMPYENNQPIWVARDLRLPILEIWPRLKHYD